MESVSDSPESNVAMAENAKYADIPAVHPADIPISYTAPLDADVRDAKGHDAKAVERESHEAARKYAVLMGVDEYDVLSDLKYCGRDVKSLGDRLSKLGFASSDLVVLHDEAERGSTPTKARFLRALSDILARATPQDVVVVAFSGHGVHLGGNSYLCPPDASLQNPSQLISLNDVYRHLEDCPAHSKLLIVDACRNTPRRGARSIGSSKETVGFAKSLREPPGGIMMMTSCSPGELSFEDDRLRHGVFMHYVLDALSGAGAVGDDADALPVTLLGIFAHASRGTLAHARRRGSAQTPWLKADGRDIVLGTVSRSETGTLEIFDGDLLVGREGAPSPENCVEFILTRHTPLDEMDSGDFLVRELSKLELGYYWRKRIYVYLNGRLVWRPGTQRNEQERIQWFGEVGPGKHTVEFVQGHGFPLSVMAKFEIEVRRGQVSTLCVVHPGAISGIDVSPDLEAAAVSVEIDPLGGFWEEDVKSRERELEAAIRAYSDEPIVQHLKRESRRFQTAPPTAPTLRFVLPEKQGGPREFDGAQIKHFVQRLQTKYFPKDLSKSVRVNYGVLPPETLKRIGGQLVLERGPGWEKYEREIKKKDDLQRRVDEVARRCRLYLTELKHFESIAERLQQIDRRAGEDPTSAKDAALREEIAEVRWVDGWLKKLIQHYGVPDSTWKQEDEFLTACRRVAVKQEERLRALAAASAEPAGPTRDDEFRRAVSRSRMIRRHIVMCRDIRRRVDAIQQLYDEETPLDFMIPRKN